MSAFRTPHATEYAAWLLAWLEQGNKPTHYYDYPMQRATWLMAERDFTTGGECGSDSAYILVPVGVRHSGPLGHNGLYLMEGPTLHGAIVPVYGDAEFADLPGIAGFVVAKKEEHRQWLREVDVRRAASRKAAARSDIGRHFGRTET